MSEMRKRAEQRPEDTWALEDIYGADRQQEKTIS